jgi:hypothetical protein
MRKTLSIAATALTAAAIVPAATQAHQLTTVPGQVYVLKTVVDETGIHIPKDAFTRNGVTRYPRGALIRYEFVNKGKRAYSVHIWFFKSAQMKPGGHASQFVNWNYRGTFHYARMVGGKQVKPLGTIVVF